MASKPWTTTEVARAVALYRDEYSASDIASMLDRSKDGVLHVLRANGVSIRRRGAQSVDQGQVCHSFRRMVEDAQHGSRQLLAAIQCAGVRP